jgi:hypothetical protein
MARAGIDIGTAAHECLSRGKKTGITCENALLDVGKLHPERRLFIDSGAFSEVYKADCTKTKKRITRPEWKRRLALMERVGKVWGDRLLIMAPDKVCDQAETLRRLRWFRKTGWLDRFRRPGVEIAVVVQGGKLSPLQFDREAAEILGWPGYTVAFPMAKGATEPDAIVRFMRARVTPRVHLLGIGPRSERAPELRRKLFDAFPRVEWSWDTAMLGRDAHRDPKRYRPYTLAQDIERKDVISSGWEHFDFTEMGSEPSIWLLSLWKWPKAQKCMKELLEAGGKQLGVFGSKPIVKRRRRPLKADTPAQRARWSRKKAKWDACRAEFEAEAFKTGRRIGVPEDELMLFAYDPDRYVYSDFPDLAGGWSVDRPRYVHDPYFSGALEGEFNRWLTVGFDKGGAPEPRQLMLERAVYRAYKDRGIELPGQQLVAGLVI